MITLLHATKQPPLPATHHSFQAFPVVRGKGNYKLVQNDCHKVSYGHSTLTPRIFTVYSGLQRSCNVHRNRRHVHALILNAGM
jgi:hypothetical protein